MNFYWSVEEVLKRLDDKISVAFHAVLDMSLKEKVYMRDAAYLVSIERVVKAMQHRGWI
jgi:glutamate dehydrogenase (NAD(P)+)